MLNDLRYAIRTLLKNPGFALVAMVTLALGIGANTAIFSVVHGVLLRPLPYPDPERIVNVWTSTGQEPHGNHSAGDFIDIGRQNQSLSALAGYRSSVFTVAAQDTEPMQLEGTYVTVDFFDVLGLPPAAGRLFSRASDLVPGDRLVVLGDDAWQQLSGRRCGYHRLAGARSTASRAWSPDPRAARRVPGRLEDLGAVGQAGATLAAVDEDPQADRDVRYFSAIARLKPGLSLQQARLDLERVGRGHPAQRPADGGRTDDRDCPDLR